MVFEDFGSCDEPSVDHWRASLDPGKQLIIQYGPLVIAEGIEVGLKVISRENPPAHAADYAGSRGASSRLTNSATWPLAIFRRACSTAAATASSPTSARHSSSGEGSATASCFVTLQD